MYQKPTSMLAGIDECRRSKSGESVVSEYALPPPWDYIRISNLFSDILGSVIWTNLKLLVESI